MPRQGEHYLTAADPESGGKWRLKGAIYERDFQRERLTSSTPEEGRAGPGTDRSTDSERAEEARRKLEAERCLFLGILAGSWGLTRWYSNHIQSLIETKAMLEFEIQEARQTVDRLEETTWGVVLHEGEEGRKFAVLPAGSLQNPPWTVGGRPAVPLFSE